MTDESSNPQATHDQPCFVFGFALDGQGGGRAIDGSFPTDEPQWLHIDYSGHDAASWLAARGLDEGVIESLTRLESRPRTVVAGSGTLVVLRGINLNPGADPEDMVSLRAWIEPNRLITVRQRRLMSVQDVRDALDAGRGPLNPPDVVTDLVECLADRIADFVDDVEARMSEFEESVESDKPSEIRPKVSALRRQTAVVRRFVAPQREALEALCRRADDLLDEHRVYAIRDQSDRIMRSVEDLDLVKERALVVQEELLNRISQEQNARMYVLSIVAAIFLPITFITGLFGMNTAGLPGLENPLAFWEVMIALLVVSLGMLCYLRAKRWL